VLRPRAGSLLTENLDGLDRVTEVPVNQLAEGGPALLVQEAIDKQGDSRARQQRRSGPDQS
jgi:hypothetical protein